MELLAIESSCDETAAAVVRDGREVLSNIIASQIETHKLYGGVVPEIASRKHIEVINQVIDEALVTADRTLNDMDAICVTYGPGLVGALLVGVGTAKAMAYAADKPLVGVHHIEGHIAANYIVHPDLEPPFLCMVASGGHSHLVIVKDYGEYDVIGRTHDDAAGEAFDKVARAIGLGYPGGPKIDAIAREGNPNAIEFPRASIDDAPYDFSFSGVKSAVLNYLNSERMRKKNDRDTQKGAVTDETESDDFAGINRADVAASFQEAVVDVLVGHTMDAALEFGMNKVALAGGVACNSRLREKMSAACEDAGYSFYMPPPILCTDNAAMIGAAGYYEYKKGVRHGLDLNAIPALSLR
ncbi:MAG: tRNA (adenosine(37)-N6)-threonylcarbamoyltransferase complex transferase subunit TsaD [Eubacterium sp.]|nr:tRNA (adenosine(37)-N6)-threonylcarbamoyltransferase complex transferase subunit TsaD [Eubacterium sp.]